jgi:hypothetical protein
MSLDKLSDDILLCLAEWVGTHAYVPHYDIIAVRGTRFLGPLALCSRRLNRIVTPLLYRTFTQTGMKALPTFLHLLLNKPKIGAEVRKFVGSEVHEEDPLDMSMFSPEDFEQLRNTIDSFGDLPVDKSEWMTDVEEGLWEAIMCLLLFFLPSLEEIDMVSYAGRDAKYIIPTFNQIACNQAKDASDYSLKHLRTISVAYSDTESGMDIEALLPFCTPPSVSQIVAHMVSEESFPASFSHRYEV